MGTQESYLESVRSQLITEARREKCVGDVIAHVQQLIRDHFKYDNDELHARVATIDPDKPNEVAWLSLADKHGNRITRELAGVARDKAALVGSAAFRVSGGEFDSTVFTITMNPPNVLGRDRLPLDLEGIAGVEVDLQQYANSLTCHPR